MNNPFFNAIRNINAVLDPDQKRRSFIMIGLMIVNAFFDVLGLATIFVLIKSALEGDIITSTTYTRTEEISTAEHYFNLVLRDIYLWSGAHSEIELLFYLSIVIFIVFLIKNGLSLWITYIQTRFSYNISLRLNKKMFKYHYDQGYLFLSNVTSGKKVYNIVDIPMRFAANYLISTFFLATELLVITILSLALLAYNPLAIVMLMLVICPVFLLIYLYSKNKIKAIGYEKNKLMPFNYARIIESMKAYVDVKLMNKENQMLSNYESSQKALNRTDVLNLGIYQRIHQKTNDIIFGLGILVIFSYAYFTGLTKSSVLTLLGFFGIAAYKVLPAVNRMMNSILSIKNSSFVIDELKILTNSKLKEFEVVEPLEFKNSINLSNLTFKYPNSDLNVLSNINLDIKYGETIGIVGKSGSGKTTLLKILLRILKESEGQFKVDDLVLNSSSRNSSFQKAIGYVEQDVFIMNGTLEENIAFKENTIDSSLLNKAIKNAMLEKFVQQQELGLQMQLGEEGVKLSGGQKQRVGIARALYKKSDILIFDEVTSALDPSTEKAIVQSINHLSEIGKTIIIVAHRISTLEKCDRIIELKNGQIHRELSYIELLNSTGPSNATKDHC